MPSPLRILLLLACATGCAYAHAHDAWIETRGDGLKVLFGHEGRIDPVPLAKVKAVAAFDEKGARLPVKVEAAAEHPRVSVTGRAAMLTLDYDNGFWSRTTEGTRNLPKTEVPGALGANHVLKFGKTLLHWNAAMAQPRGQRLELLPLAAPGAGKPLPVRVMWEGKPLAGAKLKIVAADGTGKETLADAQGRALVMATQGRNSLHVEHRIDLVGDPRADVLSVASVLVFEAR